MTSPAPERFDPTPGTSIQRTAGQPLDHVPVVPLQQLLCAFSQALDLAEGRARGHALRVSFISLSVARALGLTRQQCGYALLAGLLHDVGVPHATEAVSDLGRAYEHELFARSPLHSPESLAGSMDRRRTARVTDAFHEHAFEGATAAAGLGLPPAVAETILCHHERHDGSGFPLGLSGNEVPQLARIVAAADYAEALLMSSANPLLARRNLEPAIREQAGRAFHPQVVEALVSVTRQDGFWLAFHSDAIPGLVATAGAEGQQPLTEDEILRTTAAFADIVDARNTYRRGHSRRAAAQARNLALALSLEEGHARAVELAALLHDVGMLRVPSRIIAKPEILTVDEMHLLHEHPLETAEIVRSIPAWEPIAEWTAAHHERLDGRGYPEGMLGDQIPLEARILAITDVYEALTANRPHRPALTPEAALDTMRAMAGVTIDPDLFATFVEHRLRGMDALTAEV